MTLNPSEKNSGTGILTIGERMKVVSDIIVLTLLEQMQLSADNMVKILEISSKVSPNLDIDINIAKRNLADINRHIESIKAMAFEAVPKESHDSALESRPIYNPLPASKLASLFSLNDSDFLKSNYCTECEGAGYIWLRHENPMADNEKEQCPSCEELHASELKADRLHDEAKGN